MGLLDEDAKTTVIKQAETAAAIRGQISALYDSMKVIYEQTMGMVWNNQQGLSPQEVLDAFGGRGWELFTLGGLLKYTINTVKPGTASEMPSYYDVVFNPDGTVSIVLKSSSSSDSSEPTVPPVSEVSDGIESSSSSVEIA